MKVTIILPILLLIQMGQAKATDATPELSAHSRYYAVMDRATHLRDQASNTSDLNYDYARLGLLTSLNGYLTVISTNVFKNHLEDRYKEIGTGIYHDRKERIRAIRDLKDLQALNPAAGNTNASALDATQTRVKELTQKTAELKTRISKSILERRQIRAALPVLSTRIKQISWMYRIMGLASVVPTALYVNADYSAKKIQFQMKKTLLNPKSDQLSLDTVEAQLNEAQ